MLDWTKQQQTIAAINPPDKIIITHTAECSADSHEPVKSHEQIKSAIEHTIEKAVEVLHDNIQDDSLYFMCEWNCEKTALNIVVTDAQKQNDGPHRIRCIFSAISEGEELTETVHYWIRDYLTTCKGFMHYSLVAVFHNGNRDTSILL